jgi:MoaA/NifB/PqqE/SkfB family radical SAM enzyme
MALEDIGFYTLTDERARSASASSPLSRCELILTSACNFRCPYCRGLSEGQRGSIDPAAAMETVRLWCAHGLRNVRFSGGEPTMYRGLHDLVRYCRDHGVERIALSTNGSADVSVYRELVSAGVNDFSVSLDGGCCSTGDAMTGGVVGAWETVTDSIRAMADMTYVTAGMVFTEANVGQCVDAVLFAASLGVSDVRVIPSAQYNQALAMLSGLPDAALERLPILKYRIQNIRGGRHVRGIGGDVRDRCWLALDDMAVVQGKHYPCVIYLREGGEAIGRVGQRMRQERAEWVERHEPWSDPICRGNCLDVCQDYNRRFRELQGVEGRDRRSPRARAGGIRRLG